MHSPRIQFWFVGSTQQAVLVDTLGFDDTNKSEMQTLQMIGVWIRKTYIAIFPHAEITCSEGHCFAWHVRVQIPLLIQRI